MIADRQSGAHGTIEAKKSVSWRPATESEDTLVKRRRWLSGCTLMAFSAWLELAPAAVTRGTSSEGEPGTYFLALFPLGIVAFPGELVFLHVFEPRYVQLITECAETGIGFGIVTVVPGGASSVGTEMKLDRILRRRESGSMDVSVRGVRTFTLKAFQRIVEGKLYSGGQVSFHRNDPGVDPDVQSALAELYNRMQHLAQPTEKLAPPYPNNLSFFIGHDVGLSRAQELQLLTMPAERDRQAYLLQHLLRKG